MNKRLLIIPASCLLFTAACRKIADPTPYTPVDYTTVTADGKYYGLDKAYRDTANQSFGANRLNVSANINVQFKQYPNTDSKYKLVGQKILAQNEATVFINVKRGDSAQLTTYVPVEA